MGVVDEGLQEGLDNGGGVAVDGGVDSVGFGVDFVAARVEEAAKGGYTGEEVREERGDEVGDVGGVEFQLAGRGLGRVGGPGLFVPRCDEVRVSICDGGGMAGSVDFEVDLDPAVRSVGLDLLKVRNAPHQS